MMIFLVLLLAIFFAMNMGGASFAAAFATAYGTKTTSRLKAGFLFLVFVVLGSVFFGENVSVTLGQDLIPASALTQTALLVIFISAGLSMFISNVMKIPQSTSLVTVAAIAGVGASLGQVYMKTFYYLIPFWIFLPLVSFGITYFLTRRVESAREQHGWFFNHVINNQTTLRRFVIVASCYNAFSVGTNNVANVVGPLMGQSNTSLLANLLIFAFVYGVGAFTFTGPLKTAGEKFVPLSLLTASIIALVCGTLMIIASSLGVPQSFVMLKMGAILAVATVKHGQDAVLRNPLTKKTFYTWTINPILTFFLSWGLAKVINSI